MRGNQIVHAIVISHFGLVPIREEMYLLLGPCLSVPKCVKNSPTSMNYWVLDDKLVQLLLVKECSYLLCLSFRGDSVHYILIGLLHLLQHLVFIWLVIINLFIINVVTELNEGYFTKS